MINLEDWRTEALDFETKYATLIKNICKLSELKNMLIESEVLSRDGGISWSTKSAINNLLRDKQEFQQGE